MQDQTVQLSIRFERHVVRHTYIDIHMDIVNP